MTEIYSISLYLKLYLIIFYVNTGCCNNTYQLHKYDTLA